MPDMRIEDLGEISTLNDSDYLVVGSGNDTYKTTVGTLKGAIKPSLAGKYISENGTYRASTDGAYGYNTVTVNVTGSAAVLESIAITSNGNYVPTGDVNGYDAIAVNVPNTYQVEDYGKVVTSSGLSTQASRSITANGTYDTTAYNRVVVSCGGSEMLSTLEVVANGSYSPSGDITGFNFVSVNVPNTYQVEDYGKVVTINGLSAQTSREISMNGTYDTTEYNRVVVSCGGSGELSQLNVIANGYFTPQSGYAGFNAVSVNVPGAFTSEDYGKVVTSMGLIPQTSRTIEYNGSYDTTSNNLVVVNCEEAPTLVSLTARFNGTYLPGEDEDGFSEVTVSVSGGGGDMDALIARTITEVNSDAETIGEYAFGYYHGLTTVSFPACTSIGAYAFCGCTSLTTVSFPVCTSIDYGAFSECTSLTTVSFPVCTSIGYNAFYECSSLTTVNFPVCTSIGYAAFYECTSLTTVSFPACTSIEYNAFYECSSLTTVSFPVCTSIGGSAFYECSSLTTVSFPVCTSIGYAAFCYCSSLTTASFPVCTSIGNYAFRGCCRLVSLYITASSVCRLSGSNALLSTPIAGYTASTGGVYGSIFVPASLVDAYKTASNWSYFSDRITAYTE